MTDKLSNRPPVGNFRSRENNPPRGSMMPSDTTPAPEKEETQAPLPVEQKSAPVDDKPLEKTTAELYRERLAAANISLSQAQTIIDAVLQKDFYEEFFELRGQKGVFRTRSYEDLLRMQKAIEREKPATQMAQDELIWRYNLAGSLAEWRGKVFKKDSDTDFEFILTTIRRLPGPVVGMLIDELTKFDNKVMLVFSNGATESF